MNAHTGTVALETKRLLLRRFVKGDSRQMFDNWANDPEVTRYLSWEPHGTIDNTQKVIDIWLEGYEKPEYYQWAMELKEAGQIIGSLGVINQNDKDENCEIGYCMSKEWWGRGIMTEAVIAVLDFLLNDIGYHRVQAVHDTNNPASGRVMQKSGMEFEGILRESRYRENDGFYSIAVYSMLGKL